MKAGLSLPHRWHIQGLHVGPICGASMALPLLSAQTGVHHRRHRHRSDSPRCPQTPRNPRMSLKIKKSRNRFQYLTEERTSASQSPRSRYYPPRPGSHSANYLEGVVG